jgi:hypothetical protein
MPFAAWQNPNDVHITRIRRENAISGLEGLQPGGPGEDRFCEVFYHR